MKHMVENDEQAIIQLAWKFPKEIQEIVINGTLEDFRKYVQYYNPITKELIHAFIYVTYVVGKSDLFGTADVADAVLETLDVLELPEVISLIEKLYILYNDSGYFLDTTRILIRLYIGTMTVKDVIDEQAPVSDNFATFIDKYLEYLEQGIHFKDLYNMMLYDYMVFCRNRNEQTIIKSHEEAAQKIKALYCANHIYNQKYKSIM